MPTIKVEKNIPMPAKKPASAVGEQKYPWDTMAVTDSFFVQGKNEGKTKRYLDTLKSKAGKRYGKTFMTEEAPTGIRVFCIATGLGTPEAVMWDFEKSEIRPVTEEDMKQLRRVRKESAPAEPATPANTEEAPVVPEIPGSEVDTGMPADPSEAQV